MKRYGCTEYHELSRSAKHGDATPENASNTKTLSRLPVSAVPKGYGSGRDEGTETGNRKRQAMETPPTPWVPDIWGLQFAPLAWMDGWDGWDGGCSCPARVQHTPSNTIPRPDLDPLWLGRLQPSRYPCHGRPQPCMRGVALGRACMPRHPMPWRPASGGGRSHKGLPSIPRMVCVAVVVFVVGKGG